MRVSKIPSAYHGLELKKAGLRIPEDISLVVWEVPGVTEYFTPGLSSVGQNFAVIAEEVETLLKNFNLSESKPFYSLVDYQFFPRKSIAPQNIPE